MELVYTVTRCHRAYKRDWSFREDIPLIALSSRNALAICTTVDLDQEDHVQSSEPVTERSIVETIYQVYVCDIDKPWSVYRLMTCSDRVVSLEWHVTGLKLLVATSHGSCYVFHMKDFLLNSWHSPPCVAKIKGEDIVVATWLSQGGQMSLSADKKDSSLYSDKLIKSSSVPSLTQFGGKPVDGLIAITSTGLAVVTLPRSGYIGTDVTVSTETLSSTRTRVCVADIAFTSSGDILAATSDGSVSSAIQCHRITLSRETDGTCAIVCRSATGFYARCHLDAQMRDSTTARITHIKYMQRDAGTLIIGAGDVGNSCVELWNLTNQPINVHRIYQNVTSSQQATGGASGGGGINGGSTGAGSGITGHFAQKWVHHSTISYTSLPMSIAVPCFPISYGYGSGFQSDGMLFQYIAIAYKDGSVKLVNRQSFQPMTTTNLDTGITDLDNCEKRRKRVAYMTHMQQSFTGCVLVGIDQYSCLYVMKVVNTRDPVTQVPPVFIVSMFEYLLVTGIDWWDSLAAIKPAMVEIVMQRLNENFQKQPLVIQELLYCRFMALKAGLCRTSTAGVQIRAADCHCRLLLHCTSNYFKSSLRPKALSAGETSPSERLSMICSNNTDLDIDTVVTMLSPEKKFVVDTVTLLSMQPLIQWIADLSLYLISALSLLHTGNSGVFAGVTLLRDVRALGTLRELLVIVRTWSLISTSCLPRFTTLSAGFDCLPQLFKLLTKMWLVARDGSGRDYDDALIDECSAFTSQLVSPSIDEGLFGDTSYSLSLFSQNYPVKYIYNERPTHSFPSVPATGIMTVRHTFPPGLQMSRHRKDIVRQISLGCEPSELTRQCLRCGCHSLVSGASKIAAVRAWELRFERTCVCGGPWKLDSCGTPVVGTWNVK